MEYLDNTGRQRLGDALKDAIDDDAKLSIIASYFTVFSYGELREELEKVSELRFIFDQPTFAKQMMREKDPREFVLSKRGRERGVGGTGLELTLRNNLNQRALARECAEWARERATFKSAKQRGMIGTAVLITLRMPRRKAKRSWDRLPTASPLRVWGMRRNPAASQVLAISRQVPRRLG